MSARRKWPLCLMLAAVVPGAQSVAATAASVTTPAEWQSYDILVELENLPRSYTCDDLWYRLRDLLLQLGARTYMTIEPYHCAATGTGPACSPGVQLKFQLPRLLYGATTRYAELQVAAQTVHIAPGVPRSLQATDCELVRQLQDELLAALPVQVVSAAFSCAPGRGSFALALGAQLPAPAAVRQAAAAVSAAAYR